MVGSSAFTGLMQWAFYYRKHKATVGGLENINDRSEIENYQFVAKEWRETAQQCKDMADKYQAELIEISKGMSALNRKLTRAYKRIEELEKHLE